MMKFPTGRKIPVETFKLLNQCVRCGYADLIEDGGQCIRCFQHPISECEICTILLRQGKYKFYAYDNKDEYRDVAFNPLQNDIHEFAYEKKYKNPVVNDLCTECIDWEFKMKDKCVKCQESFINSKGHYKEFGNICEPCLLKK